MLSKQTVEDVFSGKQNFKGERNGNENILMTKMMYIMKKNIFVVQTLS